MTKEKVLAFLSFLFLALLISATGCAEKTPSIEEIKEQVLQKEANIEDCSFTIHINLHIDDEALKREFDVMNKGDMYRIITKKPGKAPEKIEGSDGEYMWTYYPRANTAIKKKLPEKSGSEENESGQKIGSGIISGIINSGNVTVLGTEKIEGRNAYLLEIRPEEEIDEKIKREEKDNEEEDKEENKEENKEKTELDLTKLWIDKETGMPLRYETYNENMRGNIEFRNLKVNTGIPDSNFEFEVPEGTEVKIREFGKSYPPENLTPPDGEKDMAATLIFNL